MRWILESEENEDDLERIGKDRKIGIPILLIQLVTVVTNSYIRTVQINCFLWEGRMDGVGF